MHASPPTVVCFFRFPLVRHNVCRCTNIPLSYKFNYLRGGDSGSEMFCHSAFTIRQAHGCKNVHFLSPKLLSPSHQFVSKLDGVLVIKPAFLSLKVCILGLVRTNTCYVTKMKNNILVGQPPSNANLFKWDIYHPKVHIDLFVVRQQMMSHLS